MVTEFPSNRHKDKAAGESVVEPQKRKKVEQVVRTEVVRRKKPLGKRFMETFIGTDPRSVWGFVAIDVLIPAAKDMVADAVSQGVERMIFGDARSTSRRGGPRHGGPYINYSGYSKPRSISRRLTPMDPRDEPRQNISRRARVSHDFDEIILETRVEAEEVIDRLYDLVSKYEMATVADLYELVGIPINYTDDKWGWMELPGAGVSRVRQGYLLNLPRPEPLN